MAGLTNKLTYAYIKNIKRWMFCPVCGDKMRVKRKSSMWECQKCDYSLSVKEFENDYVFWFCDGCKTFLNNQSGFDINKERWICLKCGHDNDMTSDNIKDTCRDCGVELDCNAKYGLCDSCRTARLEIWANRLKTGATVVGVIGAAVGATYLAKKCPEGYESGSSNGYGSLDTSGGSENDYPSCYCCGSKMAEFDGCSWYTCPDCGNRVRNNDDGSWTWENEIFGSASSSNAGICANCGGSLKGGSYAAPWENGNNPDGYIKCPHCRYVNFQWND